MGISFGRDDRIAGYRPTVFKKALDSYHRTNDPGKLIDLATIFPHRRDGAIVYEECLDGGFIDADTTKVTDAGLTIIRSKSAKRASAAEAALVLDRFLDAVHDHNSNRENISRVEEVWLFGSHLRGAEDVGDIDLSLRINTDPRFDGNLDSQIEAAVELVETIPSAPVQWTFPWDRIDWLLRRSIFGPKRHRLLAGVQFDTDDLALMAVPCRLIYDRAKGGRVAEPILPRHPSSHGRSNSVPDLPRVPAHRPQIIRPMNAKWVTAYSKWSDISPMCIFRSWSDACHRLFPKYPTGLSVVVDGDEHSHLGWVSDAMRQGGLDGRDSVGIHYFDDLHGTYVTLRRCIMSNDRSLTLQVSFTSAEWLNGLKKPHRATFDEIASVISLILAVDAERMFRREIESESNRTVQIQIVTDGIAKQFGAHFAESIFNMLNYRVVAIEPQADANAVKVSMGRSA